MPTHFTGTPAEVLALDTLIKLTRANNSLLARIAHRGTHPDLSVSQFGTLEALYHLGAMSQTEICSKLLKSGGNTTLVIDNLEKRGLVQRRRDTEDRRVMMVELTAAGFELISAIFPHHAQVVAEEMSVLTPEEQRTLGELCKKLGKGAAPPDASA
ncbi:MAG TPA: MarR family transcriptional regulator [Chloroflexi bacterium]|nr:MarR family transcriptional regulator [Chloroflexota bacterium]HHW85200.1 MarR family transcriptional regulator [Chloroflexota bacterium]